MSNWIARYEEGYITTGGESVTLTDELHQRHPWRSPEEARLHWSMRGDLAPPRSTTYRNGLMQTDDVRDRRAFLALGVVAIWRRVTFQEATSEAAVEVD